MDLKVQFWGPAFNGDGNGRARVGESDLSNVRFLYFCLHYSRPPTPLTKLPFWPKHNKNCTTVPLPGSPVGGVACLMSEIKAPLLKNNCKTCFSLLRLNAKTSC